MSGWRFWLLAAIWIAWESYWIISARATKRAASKEPWVSRGPVVAGILLSVALLFIPELFGSLPARSFTGQGDATYFSGLLLTLCGVSFAFWARFTLGRNWSGRVTIKEDHELVTRGPYRLVRHPIYTGALLTFGGTALAFGRVGGLLAVAIMTTVFLRKIWLEEKVLDQHFGPRYADYRKTAKTLIPLLW
jgi:protein-S-isoprenylcysteine O-methyltransferase Ste14